MASPRLRLRALAARSVLGAVLSVGFLPLVSAPQAAGQPEVSDRTVAIAAGALADGATLAVDVEGGPELIALTWASPDEAAFEVRARDGAGWGQWFTLAGHLDEGPDTSSAEWSPSGYAGPAFLGRDISEIELRATTAQPPGLVVHAIDSEPVAPAEGIASAAVAQPPSLITRAQWGADESWRNDSGGECDGTPRYSDDIKMAAVHHTVSRNDYTAGESAAIVRGIYDFHVHSNGWCDVGYNFFVDRFGQVFEGRYGGVRRTAIGGHTSGFNTVATGVALIGDFSTAAVPAAAYSSLVDVLAFKLAFHGVDPKGSSTVRVGSNSSARWPEGTTVTLPNIEGHRDSNNTACPGEQLYARLPQLRNDVADAIASRGLQPAFELGRLASADRYATAGVLARNTYATANTVFLARGDGPSSFPDALAANYLAGLASAPILLATATSVPQATLDWLSALQVKNVRLLGGTSALGSDVVTALQSRGYAVDRIAGSDRFDTAAAIARAAGSGAVGLDPSDRRVAVLSSGRSFPDALAAGTIVYGRHFPQLLSEQDALPATTAAALQDLGIQHVLITGGPLALSGNVEEAVKGLGMTTERIAGSTRYDTGVALADLAIDRFGYSASHLEVATGENFPDALTGGVHAGHGRTPIILTQRLAVPGPVCSYLQRRGGNLGSGHLYGGTTAVESGTKYRLQECIQPA